MTDVLLRLCKTRDTAHQGFVQLLSKGFGGAGRNQASIYWENVGGTGNASLQPAQTNHLLSLL